MNPLDRSVLAALNRCARRWPILDLAAHAVANANLLKGVAFVAVLVWFWGANKPEARGRTRELVLQTGLAAVLALAAARLLQVALPFRERPLHAPGLSFVPPFGSSDLVLREWSAFPSDHALLFGALATGIWYLSRRAGIAAHLYAALVIYLPRLYVGYHHLTDVLAGWALGVGMAWLAHRPPIRRRLAGPILRWSERHARAFLVVSFLAALQVATMFGDVRDLASQARTMLCLSRHDGTPEASWERCTRRPHDQPLRPED